MSTQRPKHAGIHARDALLITLAGAILATGCATKYNPPSAANKSNAWLVAVSPLWVVTIDNAKVSRFGISGEKRFALAPGAHVITVQYSGGDDYRKDAMLPRFGQATFEVRSHNHLPVNFVAEAGHTYYVKDGRSGLTWKPYVSEDRDLVFQEVKAP